MVYRIILRGTAKVHQKCLVNYSCLALVTFHTLEAKQRQKYAFTLRRGLFNFFFRGTFSMKMPQLKIQFTKAINSPLVLSLYYCTRSHSAVQSSNAFVFRILCIPAGRPQIPLHPILVSFRINPRFFVNITLELTLTNSSSFVFFVYIVDKTENVVVGQIVAYRLRGTPRGQCTM